MLASLPDVDQDGVADFAAGAFEPHESGLDYRIGVRSGRDGTFLKPLLAAGEHVVGGLGVPDVDGDGTADVLIGMLQAFGEPGGNLARGVLLASKTHTASADLRRAALRAGAWAQRLPARRAARPSCGWRPATSTATATATSRSAPSRTRSRRGRSPCSRAVTPRCSSTSATAK
jgi:hypothetical protein